MSGFGERYSLSPDTPEAEQARIFRELADHGDPYACNNLAGFYAQGKGGLPQDLSKAFELFKQAAEAPHYEHGAQYNVSVMLMQGMGVKQDPAAAWKWCLRSAQQGHTDAIKALREAGRACAHCGGAGSGDGRGSERLMRRCSRCQTAYFCGKGLAKKRPRRAHALLQYLRE